MPGFWNDVNVEPKRKFRFLMDLGTAGGTLASYYIKTVKKPTFSMDGAQEVKYIGHTFKYPGRVKWEDIDITVLDPASPDASAILLNIITNSGYNVPKLSPDVPSAPTVSPIRTISKAASINALGSLRLSQIDHLGTPIETWTLHSPFLQKVDFGDVGYDADDIVQYTLTVSYDWATLSVPSKHGTVLPGVKSDT